MHRRTFSIAVNSYEAQSGEFNGRAVEKRGRITRHTPVLPARLRTYYRRTTLSMVSCCGRRKSYQNEGRPGEAARLRRFVSGLYRFHSLGLPPLGALYYVKLYLLAFLQTAESARLDRREVHEYILATLAADKTVALGIVKPLYCSCFHGVARFLLVRYALCPSQNFFRQVTPLSRELLKTAKSNAAGLYLRYSWDCQTISQTIV